MTELVTRSSIELLWTAKKQINHPKNINNYLFKENIHSSEKGIIGRGQAQRALENAS